MVTIQYNYTLNCELSQWHNFEAIKIWQWNTVIVRFCSETVESCEENNTTTFFHFPFSLI